MDLDKPFRLSFNSTIPKMRCLQDFPVSHYSECHSTSELFASNPFEAINASQQARGYASTLLVAIDINSNLPAGSLSISFLTVLRSASKISGAFLVSDNSCSSPLEWTKQLQLESVEEYNHMHRMKMGNKQEVANADAQKVSRSTKRSEV